mmetsp:Transcript_33856/g.40946  ORF Transcript_33856/g.40946 Transcript_33856/m.40946 type:complete len:311 (-) Transcript_33856:209-1141(-)|eukprot:CAMPEP_0197863280 /NCGR_PEP_ID=MMETSP1438-20131217/40604_1 /TAXON_ID=1461541 /ORGANISM="Pterosperma sp., Strain CCMP1384" /LENGTH=310 /DNA_ID=CAMNT_0043481107 /DNA_START=119 /DNA_END=1051 /DNA_ORIENTATION=-
MSGSGVPDDPLLTPNPDIPRLLSELSKPKGPSNAGSDAHLWQADPFYEAAEAVQEDMDLLHKTLEHFHKQYHSLDEDARQEKKRELEEMCRDISSQVPEFESVLKVTSKDPTRFHVSEEELERRRTFVRELSCQVASALVSASQPPPPSPARPAPGGGGGEETSGEGESSALREAAQLDRTQGAVQDYKTAKKPSGVLLGQVGKLPAWEQARLEDLERQKQEAAASSGSQDSLAPQAEYTGVMGGAAPPAYFVSEPASITRGLQEEIEYRYHEAVRALANTDHYLLASFLLLFLGVFGLHTFYGHDESLI